MNLLYGDDIPNRYNFTNSDDEDEKYDHNDHNDHDKKEHCNNNMVRSTSSLSIHPNTSSNKSTAPPSRYDPESMKRIGLEGYQSEEDYMEDVLSSVLPNPKERAQMIQMVVTSTEDEGPTNFQELNQWDKIKWWIGIGMLVFLIAFVSTVISSELSSPPSNLSSLCSTDSTKTKQTNLQECAQICSVAKSCCYKSPLSSSSSATTTTTTFCPNNEKTCNLYSTHCSTLWKQDDAKIVTQLCSSSSFDTKYDKSCFEVCNEYSCCYNPDILCNDEVIQKGYCEDVFEGCDVLVHPSSFYEENEESVEMNTTTIISTTTTTPSSSISKIDNENVVPPPPPPPPPPPTAIMNTNEVTSKCPPTLAKTFSFSTAETVIDTNAIDACRDICTGHMCCVVKDVLALEQEGEEGECKCHDVETCQLYTACEVLLKIPTWLPLLEEVDC